MKETAPIRRHIQQQIASTASRTIVEVHQLSRSLNAGILALMPEPAGANRDVPLGRHPFGPSPRSGLAIFVPDVPRRRGAGAIGTNGIVRLPASLVGVTPLVAHPANVRSDIAEDHGIR